MTSKLVQRAHYLTAKALEVGVLVRPNTCEICNSKTYRNQQGYLENPIVPHHYAGYEKENALKVWWLCQSCNRRLHGYHDGSLTIEQAAKIVKSFCIAPLRANPQRCKYELAPGLKCRAFIGNSQNEYCQHHRNGKFN